MLERFGDGVFTRRDSGGYLRLAVPALAGTLLPGRDSPTALVGVLRRAVRHGRGEQRVLPAARARYLPVLARPYPAGLPLRGQDEPLPDPHQAAARPGRTGPAVHVPSRGARRQVGAGTPPATTITTGRF